LTGKDALSTAMGREKWEHFEPCVHDLLIYVINKICMDLYDFVLSILVFCFVCDFVLVFWSKSSQL
jgi:hypothetical protein